jgi:tetratricopeptide (TPR) repeat protein
VSEAATLGYQPLRVRAWLRLGSSQWRAGDYEAGEATLISAYDAAVAQRMTTEAAKAASELVFVLGHYLARPEEALSWALHADPLSRAVGTADARALYFDGVGAVAQRERRHEQARDYFQQTLVLREQALGPDHPHVAASLSSLGAVAESMGELDEARSYLERALAIKEKTLGPDHASVGTTLYNLGNVAHLDGDFEAARDYYLRSLAVQEAALGPDHPELATTLSNLGNTSKRRGNFEEARGYYERALAIRQAGLGPNHPNLAYLLTGLGNSLIGLSKPDEAISQLERSLEICSANNLHPGFVASTQFALAQALYSAPEQQGRDRVRARELAKLARTTFVELGEEAVENLAEVDAWLAEHGG